MQCISLFKRLMILMYESFLLLAIYVVVGGPITYFFKIIYDPKMTILQQPSYMMYLLFMLCIFYLYFWFCWTRGGQTLAMKAWRCKVISDNGETISRQQSLLRYVGGITSVLFFGGGFLLSLFRTDKATLHDLLSNSYLVQLPKKSKIDE